MSEAQKPNITFSRNLVLAILSLVLIGESAFLIYLFSNQFSSPNSSIGSSAGKGGEPTKEIPRTAILSLEPKEGSFKVGEEFKIKIILDTKEYPADAVDVRLKFNPQVLRVVKIEPGKIFDDYPAKRADTEAGVIIINGITGLTKTFQGKDTFAEITFKGNKAGKAEFLFEYEPSSTVDSNVVAAKIAKDVLGEVEGASIEIVK